MPNTQDSHVSYTRHEWTTQTYFKNVINLLKEKKIKSFIDLGANVGEVSKILLENIPTVEFCYLFEPQINNYEFLIKRFTDNNLVNCIKKGIYYGKTTSHLYRQDDNVGGFSIEKNIKEESEIVDLTELEKENIKLVDFVKIDIEGGEYNVLKNSTYIKNVPYMEIEFHPLGAENNDHESFIKKYLTNYKIILKSDGHYFLEKE
jgi:FkbM family methyltransferase